MRMGQFEAAFCLTLELIKHRMILNQQVGDKLQRDIALQFFVACQQDNSHSATPKDLDQRVAAKDSLPAGELMRRRSGDTPHALVSHLDNISMTKMERKVKAGSGRSWAALRIGTGAALPTRAGFQNPDPAKTIRDIRFRVG